ncbi:MAG: TolC family protein [Bacteroidia bacterium]|nr:TolC family protein [Bacteroidia bacterium]
MKRLFLFFTTLLVSHCAGAQVKKWTLKDCIDQAFAKNLDVQQGALNVRNSFIDFNQSKLALLPNANASAGQNYQFGRTIDRFTNTFVNQTLRTNNVSLGANLTIFNGLQNQNTIKQQNLALQATQESLEATKNTIALNVASLFLQILFNKENLVNNQNQVDATKRQIERAEILYNAGSTDQSNLLSLKAQVANEELTLINTKNLYNSNLINLKNLIQAPANEEFEIEAPDIDSAINAVKFSASDAYQANLNRMPQIKASELRIQSAMMYTRVARGLRSPNISLYANLSTVYSQSNKEVLNLQVTGTSPTNYFTENTFTRILQPTYSYDTKTIGFGKQLKNNFGQSLGVSLNWTLFNANQINSQILKSKISLEQSQLDYEKTKNALYTDINLAQNDYNAAEARLNATKNSFEAQQLNLDYADKKFTSGVLNSVDFLAIKNSYTNSQSLMLQAKYEFVFRSMILDYYNGKSISL